MQTTSGSTTISRFVSRPICGYSHQINTDCYQSLVWDPSAKVTEEIVVDEQHAEQYVKLAATGNFKKTVTKEASPESYTVPLQETDRLVYIPYYYRANRGGSGQMRVAVRCG